MPILIQHNIGSLILKYQGAYNDLLEHRHCGEGCLFPQGGSYIHMNIGTLGPYIHVNKAPGVRIMGGVSIHLTPDTWS